MSSLKKIFIFKLILVLLLFLGKSFTGYAQDFFAKAKLDSFQIEMGDQVNLVLKVDQPKNLKVRFPHFKDTLIGGIDIVDISSIDSVIKDNRLMLSQKIRITSFDDSLFRIPALPFISKNDTVYTQAISFDVHMISVDSAMVSKIDTTQMLKIFDLKAPIDAPWSFKEFVQRFYPYFLILVGIVLLFFLIKYYLKMRKENKPFINIRKPKLPAHVIAFKKLDELKDKKLWHAGKVKQYYSELTDIIREYIENRYHISSFERTSYELLEILRHSNILDKERIDELSQLFGLADLAKFAKFKPLPDENDLSFKNTYSFVEHTKIKEKKMEEDKEKQDTMENSTEERAEKDNLVNSKN